MNALLRVYLRLLAVFTMLAAIGHLAFPMRVGFASAWGFSPGWQREIGFWDLAMFIIIVRTLRLNDLSGGRTVAIGLVVLQILAGVNHMLAHSTLNLVLAVLNIFCIGLGIAALVTERSRANAT
jgi:hypothetical protein